MGQALGIDLNWDIMSLHVDARGITDGVHILIQKMFNAWFIINEMQFSTTS
jgi:hypothetical protein